MTKAKRIHPSHLPITTLEPLEERRLLAAWTYWISTLGLDKVFQQYPWLTGGSNNVAVIDQGIDYWHPALGGNKAAGIKAPRVVNVWDYKDNNNDPFPKTSEKVDGSTAHGTGEAGILIGKDGIYNGEHFRGILSSSLVFNFRIDPARSQQTIKQALDWIIANRVKYHITAVNLTDYQGGQRTPAYAAEVQTLYNAGVFLCTAVNNNWQTTHKAIGYPSKSPYIFGVGGVYRNGTFDPNSARGANLDILGPSQRVDLPYYYPSTGQHVFTPYGTGNSWGSPHVVGTAMLMQQIDPSLNPTQIMDIMKQTGVPVADPYHTGNYVRLNALAAIQRTYQVRDDAFNRGAGNHTTATAANITLGSRTTSVPNMKFLLGAPDWYKFTVPSNTTVTMRLGYSVLGQRLSATVFNSKQQTVGSLAWRGLTATLSPGTYYMVVNSAQSLYGTYSVNLTPVAATAAVRAQATTAVAPAIAPAQAATPAKKDALETWLQST